MRTPPRAEAGGAAMVGAGLDVGIRAVKLVVVDQGRLVHRALARSGADPGPVARRLLAEGWAAAGLEVEPPGPAVITGVGRSELASLGQALSEVSAAARGGAHLVPGARVVVDVGAEQARAIRCEGGRALRFAVNDKCAAGAGAFAEALARALDVRLEELGPLAARATRTIPMNAQCVVFAESEVVSLIHDNVAPADIVRSVNEAVAARVAPLVRRVGAEPPVVLVGGMALNPGFVAALGQALGLEPTVPEQPELAPALGAALAAAERGAEPAR